MNGRKWRGTSLGAHLAAETGSARPVGFACFPPMQKTIGYGIGISSRESGGFLRVLEGQQGMGFLYTVNSALAQSMGRRRATWAGANPYPHPLSSSAVQDG
jgi:hypothetical protein